jgi:hypothetical protein
VYLSAIEPLPVYGGGVTLFAAGDVDANRASRHVSAGQRHNHKWYVHKDDDKNIIKDREMIHSHRTMWPSELKHNSITYAIQQKTSLCEQPLSSRVQYMASPSHIFTDTITTNNTSDNNNRNQNGDDCCTVCRDHMRGKLLQQNPQRQQTIAPPQHTNPHRSNMKLHTTKSYTGPFVAVSSAPTATPTSAAFCLDMDQDREFLPSGLGVYTVHLTFNNEHFHMPNAFDMFCQLRGNRRGAIFDAYAQPVGTKSFSSSSSSAAAATQPVSVEQQKRSIVVALPPAFVKAWQERQILNKMETGFYLYPYKNPSQLRMAKADENPRTLVVHLHSFSVQHVQQIQTMLHISLLEVLGCLLESHDQCTIKVLGSSDGTCHHNYAFLRFHAAVSNYAVAMIRELLSCKILSHHSRLPKELVYYPPLSIHYAKK